MISYRSLLLIIVLYDETYLHLVIKVFLIKVYHEPHLSKILYQIQFCTVAMILKETGPKELNRTFQTNLLLVS